MPKYFCDYCDTYLTHDSPSVRKTHNNGRKHKDNVKFYYSKWMEDQAQALIDQTIKQAEKSAKSQPNMPAIAGGMGAPPPMAMPPMGMGMPPMMPMMGMRPPMMAGGGPPMMMPGGGAPPMGGPPPSMMPGGQKRPGGPMDGPPNQRPMLGGPPPMGGGGPPGMPGGMQRPPLMPQPGGANRGGRW